MRTENRVKKWEREGGRKIDVLRREGIWTGKKGEE